ncbi:MULTISPECIES: SDR family oxidoreductase [Niallia]|uniref:SDR family oxidoreductase n=1 Tax=Niallia circulans TaxID=1397 RepID=A0A941GK34_NIACI|nr:MULTISPECIES: SDR family oxidoreductase [Niallia]EOR25191.1 short chain dehydrogenase [Niallia nealsonii AAU1]MCB5236569.1 SDR family oxidoreductase [Niallia circulans]MDU1845506.1 SDR family oxidoreductase [Niallia nealsonii]UTI44333.1 SDR family oxidoreductase [Niallia sp. RD1]
MEKKVVLITGANSGFGKWMALEFAKANYTVIASMRDRNKSKPLIDIATKMGVMSNIEIIILDITSDKSVENLTLYLQEFGRVDLLINNAGYAGAGFSEEIPIQEYQLQMDTNFFGTIRVTQAVLPFMRKQGQGMIINMSSISGEIGFPGMSPYVSSKFALEGWSESLRLELAPFSIPVILIEPGSFQTNIWTTGKKVTEKSTLATSPYFTYMNQLDTYLQKNRNKDGDPRELARKVVAIAQKKQPKMRYVVGKGTKSTILVKRIIPWKWWEKIVLFILK